MSTSAAPPAPAERAPTSNPADAHLHGRWLVLAQVGWVVVTLTVVLLNILAFPDVYGVYFTITPTELQELHQLGLSPPLYTVLGVLLGAWSQLVYLLLGLLLFVRRSTDRIPLLCALTLVTFGSVITWFNFSRGDVVPTLAANPIVHVVALVLFGVGQTALVVFFYLFPSGRFAPRWTRWAAVVAAVYYLAVIFFPAMPSNAGGLWTFFIPLSLLSAVAAQVYRYRRLSTPREREQTKWAVFGFVLAILLVAANIPLGLLLPSVNTNNQVLANLNPTFALAFPLIPVFIVIAILRSRLWDIDTIINRALVYGSLTVLLGALYAGLVIGLETVAGAVSAPANEPIALVISTLAIAALVLALRRRIQLIIDRRFYRQKYDAQKMLEDFSAALHNQVDLTQLREQLLAVVQETMRPTHVSLWLRPPERYPDEQFQRLEPAGRSSTTSGRTEQTARHLSSDPSKRPELSAHRGV